MKPFMVDLLVGCPPLFSLLVDSGREDEFSREAPMRWSVRTTAAGDKAAGA
jgi:hypothetical protein